MSQIKNIEIFFLEYPFPKHLNYKYSGGVVENMIVPIIRVTDSDGEYGIGEVTHGKFTHQPLIGLAKHFNDLLVGSETNNINQAWEKMYGSSLFGIGKELELVLWQGLTLQCMTYLEKN